MTNEGDNAVVALPVGKDGSLSTWTTASTGGAGGSLVSPTDGTPDGPDALGSQGSVQVADHMVFAVNPASNSLSAFRISYEDPTDITFLNTVGVNGDFPVSVAISSKLKIACVGSTGTTSGVSCAPYTNAGLGAFDLLRSIPLGQSNPPTGPLNGIAQVFFNEDSSSLITIVKGNGSMPDTGYIAVYPVENGVPSITAEKSVPAHTAVMFGSANIPGTDNILVSDAAFGFVILTLSDLSTPLAVTNITDQKATCWATVSTLTGTGFVDDVLVSHLVELDLGTGAIVSDIDAGNNGQGMIDLVAVGRRIYALSPGNGTVNAAVTVFDISGGRGSAKSIQNLEIPGIGRFAEGMAVLS